LSNEETLALINEPTEQKLPTEISQEILRLTGGHACLTQFLMHGLCSEGLERASVAQVNDIANSYPEKKSAFENWLEDLGEIGIEVYSLLASQDRELRQSEIRAETEQPPLKVNRALDALCFHSIVHKDEQKRYAPSGELFKCWFLENVQPSKQGAKYFNEAIFVVDICNSGLIASKYGDHALKKAASSLEEMTLRGLRDFPANWRKNRGDGFLIWFPDFATALHFAERLRHDLAVYNNDKSVEIPIHVRSGIHFGEVTVTADGERVSNATNMAVRIEEVKAENLIEDAQGIKKKAFPSEDRIFLSEQVLEELGPAYSGKVRYLCYFELKNIYGRHKLYELRAETR
jgi:class 3 adenylate cyclase